MPSRAQSSKREPTTQDPRLFGYAIEESDGKLVITFEGVYAAEVAKYLRREMSRGRAWRAVSALLPIKRFGGLASRLVRIAHRSSEAEEKSEGAEERPRTLEQIFSQGVSRDFGAFQRQMEEFRNKLEGRAEAASESGSRGEGGTRRMKRNGRRRTRR